jgi:hypothetical protein
MGSLRSLKSPDSPFGIIRPGLLGLIEVSRKERGFREFLRRRSAKKETLLSKLPAMRGLKDYDFYSILRLQENQEIWMRKMRAVGATKSIESSIGNLVGMMDDLIIGYYLRMRDFTFMSFQPMTSGADNVIYVETTNTIKPRLWQPDVLVLEGNWGKNDINWGHTSSVRSKEDIQREYFNDYILEISAQSFEAGAGIIKTNNAVKRVSWNPNDLSLKDMVDACFSRFFGSDLFDRFAIISSSSNYFADDPSFLVLTKQSDPGPFIYGLYLGCKEPVRVVKTSNYSIPGNTMYLGVRGKDSWFDAPVVLAPYLICCFDTKLSQVRALAKMKVECVNPKQIVRIDVET